VVSFTTVACRISSGLKWYKNFKNRLRLAKVIGKTNCHVFNGSLCSSSSRLCFYILYQSIWYLTSACHCHSSELCTVSRRCPNRSTVGSRVRLYVHKVFRFRSDLVCGLTSTTCAQVWPIQGRGYGHWPSELPKMFALAEATRLWLWLQVGRNKPFMMVAAMIVSPLAGLCYCVFGSEIRCISCTKI